MSKAKKKQKRQVYKGKYGGSTITVYEREQRHGSHIGVLYLPYVDGKRLNYFGTSKRSAVVHSRVTIDFWNGMAKIGGRK